MLTCFPIYLSFFLSNNKAKKTRFANTAAGRAVPADITPDSTVAECLQDPDFVHDKDNKRAMMDARTEIQENEMEQTRRYTHCLDHPFPIA